MVSIMSFQSLVPAQRKMLRVMVLGFGLLALMLGPVFVFGGGKNIYVDKDNKGSEDGSKTTRIALY